MSPGRVGSSAAPSKMRDNITSNHKSTHHHNSKHNNNAAAFADLKAEASRGLELLDKIVNDAAQVKWILKSVVTSINDLESKPTQKCNDCSKEPKKESSSPSKDKEKRDKKAKKAVLPMVSGHTVQRPSINITRVDSMPRREDSPVARRPGPASSKRTNRPGPSSSKRRGSSSDGERKRVRRSRSSSSSSSSSSGSSSSSSSSSSGSRVGSRERSNGRSGSRGGSSVGVNERRSSSGKSPPKPQPPQSTSKKPPPSISSSTKPTHTQHGSASSRFLSSAQNIEAMRKKYIKRELKIKLRDVSRLVGFRDTVRLSELEEADVQVYWREWRKPRKVEKSPVKQEKSPVRRTSREVEDPEYRPPTPKIVKPKIGPKSKMAGLNRPTEKTDEVKVKVTTTAEALRAKLREKFEKFRINKTKGSDTQLPDSTSRDSGDVKKEFGGSTSNAGSNELAAIGLNVFVSAGERKSHESVNEFVSRGLEGRSDLLEMKRDQWILMQNNKTGISSLRDDVNKGLKRVVGWGGDFEDEGREDGGGAYLVGNFYFIAREGHPLTLMRYVGSSNLPPCASNDDSNDSNHVPSGFVPVDLSSLTANQLTQLQELGSPRKKSVSSSSSSGVDEVGKSDGESIVAPDVSKFVEEESDSDY